MPKVQKPKTNIAEKKGTKRKTAPKASKAPKTARKQPAKSRPRESNATNESRQSLSGAENSGTEPRSSIRKSYTYLTARTRRIPQATVAAEWQALPGPAQQRAKDLLTTAKRTVVSGTQSQKRNEEADAVIGVLMSKIVKRLPRMPFPPNVKEVNFDLDKLLERSVSRHAPVRRFLY
jgi:hypothetical protein